jgi:DNA-binding beta-propeller fold protein YncE
VWRLLALCAALVMLAPAAAPAGGVQGPATGREVVLVANAEGGTVDVVDARAFAVLRSVDVLPDGPRADDPGQAGARQPIIEAAGGRNYAQDLDLSPDGRTLYVSRGHRGDVAAFDLASGDLLWKVAIPGFRSDHMTLSDDGRSLWVSALTENVVVKIDTASHAIVGRFEGGQWPHDNHLSQDGTLIYNASIGTIVAPPESRGGMSPPPYVVTIARTSDLRVLRTFELDRGIRPIVIPHDERRMFAQLSEYHGVVEIDLVRGEVVRRLDLPIDDGVTEEDYDFEAPHHGLAISPDESTLCAAGRASDYVALIDAGSLTLRSTAEVGDAPGWATTGPDGSHCFVPSTRADTLSVISYEDGREVARLPVGDGPKQIEAARLPEELVGAAAPRRPPAAGRLRLVRSCRRGGALRIRLIGEQTGIRSVRFRAGRRGLRDRRRPFARTLSRRALARTRSRYLSAEVVTTARPLRLVRTLPRCGLGPPRR